MKLLSLIFQGHAAALRNLASFAALTALLDAFLAILLINAAYARLQGEPISQSFFLAFIVLILVSSLVRNKFGAITAACGATISTQLRIDLLERVAVADLASIERLDASVIEAAIRAASKIQLAIPAISRFIYIITAGKLLLLYLAWLSPLAVLTTVTLFLLFSTAFAFNISHDEKIQTQLIRKEKIATSNEPGIGVYLIELTQAKISPISGHALNLLLIGIGPLIMATMLILLLPWLTSSSSEIVIGALLALCWLPVITAIQEIPVLIRGAAAAECIEQVVTQLNKIRDPEIITTATTQERNLRTLQLDSITYRHTDLDGRPTFILGPISLAIQSGTFTIITGPHGSGKSTLLKLISGLYRPNAGTVLVNGESQEWSQYRQIFDGILHVIPAKLVDALAYIATLPLQQILILDEPDTHDDLMFFNKIYKEQQHTLIIATQCEHDLHGADHIIRMDYGKIIV